MNLLINSAYVNVFCRVGRNLPKFLKLSIWDFELGHMVFLYQSFRKFEFKIATILEFFNFINLWICHILKSSNGYKSLENRILSGKLVFSRSECEMCPFLDQQLLFARLLCYHLSWIPDAVALLFFLQSLLFLGLT